MKRILILLIAGLMLASVAAPASALTSEYLEIDVHDNGDATITYKYSLSFFEQIAVFLQLADPVDELRKGLEGYSDKPVVVEKVTGDTSKFEVGHFASIKYEGTGVRYTTPELSFSDAEDVLRGYWFASMITVDLSPAITKVIFPDGYSEQKDNVIMILPITHWIYT